MGSGSQSHFPSWKRLSAAMEIRPQELHLVRFRLDRDASARQRMMALLSDDERERAARFRFPLHGDRFVVARASLRLLLGGALGESPDGLRFAYGSAGKPALADAHGGLSFNLSHSDDAALVALVLGTSVGVDIEAERESVDAFDLADRFFAAREAAALATVPLAGRMAAFFRCWTRKEAFIKAIGEGLSAPLGDFEVSFADEREPPRLLRVAWAPDEVDRFTLLDVPAYPGFAGAVAVRAIGVSARFWDAAD